VGICPVPTGEGTGVPGEGYAPLQISFIFFHFKMVHSGAFLYTNSKVLFAIKCSKIRYRGILSD